jgi:hypothetical protein
MTDIDPRADIEVHPADAGVTVRMPLAGPVTGGSRFLAPREFPELAFPAQLNPGVAPPGWRPEFFDYLYLGLPTPRRSARPM